MLILIYKNGFISIITFLLFSLLAIFLYIYSETLIFLPVGEIINEVKSPNGNYTIRAYLVNAGGATGGFAIRGELFNYTNKKKKNIYWDYRIEEAAIIWLDDENVNINGIKLNIKNDTYNFRDYRKNNPRYQ